MHSLSVSRQRGVAAVEFAVLLLPLLLIVFGITEFGRALYQYNIIVKTTRDAARYLSQQQAGNATAAAAATCLVRYGNYGYCVNGSGSTPTPLLPNIMAANVTVCDWTSTTPACTANAYHVSSPVMNLVSVSVSGYVFNSYIPFVTSNMSTITFGNIGATMRANL